MLKIRRPLGRLIFNMGIAIPGKTVFLIETAPWVPSPQKFQITNGDRTDPRKISNVHLFLDGMGHICLHFSKTLTEHWSQLCFNNMNKDHMQKYKIYSSQLKLKKKLLCQSSEWFLKNKHKIYLHLLFFSSLRKHRHLKSFLMEDKGLFILHSQ